MTAINGLWLVLGLMVSVGCSKENSSPKPVDESASTGKGLHRADLDPSIGGQIRPEHDWGSSRPPEPVEGREKWQKPKMLLESLGVGSGQVVADLGAGTGFFMPYLVDAVGGDGKVIAIEVSQDLVDRLQSLAHSDGKGRVDVRLGEFEDPHLQEAEVDWVIVVQTYAHIENRVDYFRRLKSAMRPGGRLAVVDFVMGDIPEGPPPEQRILPEAVSSEMKEAGWELASSPNLLEFHFVQVYTSGS
ncbi:MAG: class I SAM-dependent methyltransferase [Myxococcota bacterium]|nr:class I SAM-dependent methyltransferase [Myxococcota bacterium]